MDEPNLYPVEELQSFLDLLPVPAYLFEPGAYRFLAANPGYCELVGYSLDELKVLEWPRIMADDYVQPAQRALSQQAPDRPTEWRLRRKGGGNVTVALRYRVINVRSSEGEYPAYLSLVVNTTPLSVSGKSFYR